MNQKLAKNISAYFQEQLNAKLPHFSEQKTGQIPNGWRLYSWRHSDRLTFFIMLCLSPKEDRFTVDVGWSTNNQIPATDSGSPDSAVRDGTLCFRLSRLWQQFGFDHWWQFDPERNLENFASWSPLPLEVKLAKVPELVDDAINKLETYAKPYFEQIAAGRGQILH